MKTFKSLLVMITTFLLCSITQAQSLKTISESITVIIDSSNTSTTLYYQFSGARGRNTGAAGFSTTAFTPKSQVHNSGDLVLYAEIDSAAVASTTDSLSGYAIPIGHNGYTYPDTLFFDFANNTTTTTLQYFDFTPFNTSAASLGTTQYSFMINLTNRYEPCFALKIFLQETAYTNNGFNDTIRLTMAEVGVK